MCLRGYRGKAILEIVAGWGISNKPGIRQERKIRNLVETSQRIFETDYHAKYSKG